MDDLYLVHTEQYIHMLQAACRLAHTKDYRIQQADFVRYKTSINRIEDGCVSSEGLIHEADIYLTIDSFQAAVQSAVCAVSLCHHICDGKGRIIGFQTVLRRF